MPSPRISVPQARIAAETLALSALGWILSDEARAERLLALTGITAGDLVSRIEETPTLAAVLSFLEGHEPDLIACASAIGCMPERLIAARKALDPHGMEE